ncbi:MAG: hypothetical protein KDI01_06010 [Halioglobus sp.]|nr:hypothetical protein [Halioglobus sp.]
MLLTAFAADREKLHFVPIVVIVLCCGAGTMLNNALSPADWLIVVGLGALWLGAQIIWVAPAPRQLRRGEIPRAPKGTPEAFGLFWVDQYGWIGIVLTVLGLLAVSCGVIA